MWAERLIVEAAPAPFWALCVLAAAAAIKGLMLFARSANLSRLIADLPSSTIRSAAQGYVRLQGRARMLPGEPVIAPLSGKPCVWFRFKVEQNAHDPEYDRWFGSWQRVEQGSSDAIFALDDATGRCVVDPDGAEIVPSTVIVWRGREPRPGFSPKATSRLNLWFGKGPYRYTESRIHEDDSLGAVGGFRTLGSGWVSTADEEVRQVLAGWKRDRIALLRRFDRDHDGDVNLDEWDRAQQAAEQEVARGGDEPAEGPPVNVLSKPDDGRAYCLFASEPSTMAKRHRGAALLGGATFLGLAILLTWAAYTRLSA